MLTAMKIFKSLFDTDNKDLTKIESNEINNFKITKVENEHEAICPYCKTSLNKFPSRKTKCPHCNNYILVRKLNDSRHKTLVTEEQSQKIEIEQKKFFFRTRWLSEIVNFGGTEDEFYRRKADFFLKSGIQDNDNTVLWSIFNELLVENATDFNRLGQIYYSMAVFLHEEGKDNFKLLQLSAKARLDSFESCEFELKVKILGCSDSCDTCNKLNGKIISMEEAHLLPVPCRECTHRIGFCRCSYCAVGSRDSEGMLILKK